MNIRQALKAKNKLVSEINEMWITVINNNSIEKGNPRHYNIIDILENLDRKTKELIELKTKIHKANTPVYHLIFEMSELKNVATRIKNINTEEGKVNNYRSSIESIKEVQINEKQKRDFILEIQNKIEIIQEKLDQFNIGTEI